jgi:hypothetical protein
MLLRGLKAIKVLPGVNQNNEKLILASDGEGNKKIYVNSGANLEPLDTADANVIDCEVVRGEEGKIDLYFIADLAQASQRVI